MNDDEKNLLSTKGASNWIGDGTVGANLIVTNDNNWDNNNDVSTTITVSSAKQGGLPYNIRLSAPLLSSFLPSIDHTNHGSVVFFEIDVLQLDDDDEESSTSPSSLSIGFVTDTNLKPGWRTRGMFYNGLNVTNLAALKIGSFGPRSIQSGDTIGIALHRTRDNVSKTIFYFNNRCLGVGFSLKYYDCATDDDDVFYPSISITGKATVKYTAPKIIPSLMDRQPETLNDNKGKFSGDWIVMIASTGPSWGSQELPLPNPVFVDDNGDYDFTNNNIIIKFTSTSNGEEKFNEEGFLLVSYRVSIKVTNLFNTTMTIVDMKDNYGDTIEKIGPVSCSAAPMRLTPSPELEPWESFIRKEFTTLYKVKSVSSTRHGDGPNDTIIMTGTEAELICERYEEEFDPVTSYNY